MEWIEKARGWLAVRLGPRINLGLDEDHVASLAALLEEVAAEQRQRADEELGVRDEADAYGREAIDIICRERDEARAEVERLRKLVSGRTLLPEMTEMERRALRAEAEVERLRTLLQRVYDARGYCGNGLFQEIDEFLHVR